MADTEIRNQANVTQSDNAFLLRWYNTQP